MADPTRAVKNWLNPTRGKILRPEPITIKTEQWVSIENPVLTYPIKKRINAELSMKGLGQKFIDLGRVIFLL